MVLSGTVLILGPDRSVAGVAMVQESHRGGGGGGPARPGLPPDIRQNRDLNRFLGVFLIGAAVLPALPIYTEIKHSGFRRVDEWPDAFFLMGLISVAFVAIGLRLLFVSRPLGAGLTFHEGGFTIRVRRHFDMRDERFDWSGIAEIGMESFGSHRAYYIRRVDGEKLGYASIHIPASNRVFLARLQASAEAAGYRMERKGINLFLYEKYVWTVRRTDGAVVGG